MAVILHTVKRELQKKKKNKKGRGGKEAQTVKQEITINVVERFKSQACISAEHLHVITDMHPKEPTYRHGRLLSLSSIQTFATQ